jgi:hypothetical protein
MLQYEQLFGGETENGALSAARIVQSQLSLKNFLNRQYARQKALRKYSGTGKMTPLKKCRKF